MRAVRGNLPSELSSFIGRRRELAVARELMASSRLLTLTGTGGVGKTRMARRLAEETHRAFPDGTWIVELAHLQRGDFVAQSITEVFALRDDSLDPMDQLRNHLADQTLLLILDNCEHLVGECARVIGDLLAAAPSIRILTTSRQVLGVTGEQVYPVPPLSLAPFEPVADDASRLDADAVALFAERGGAASPDFQVTQDNWATVSEICRRLDGVPLAIELAAVRLRALSEEQILARLDDALDLLKVGPRTMPERQQRIEATIEWSYQLSNRAEQRLWRGLSIFAGGFTLDALEEICTDAEISASELLDALSGLVEKSIVSRSTESGRPRYHLSEVLRQFGHKRLVESGEQEEALSRHLNHYAALAMLGEAEYCSPRDREWIDAARAEQANIRVALEFALSRPETARRAMSMVAGLRPYWTHTGTLQEGFTWLRRALAIDVTPSPERLHALSVCTDLALMVAEVESASELLEQCRSLAQATDDRRFRAYLAFHETLATFFRAGPDQAVEEGERAAALSMAVEDIDAGLTAQTLAALSIFSFCADHPRALAHAEAYLRMTERRGSNLLRGIALWMVGLGHWRAGDQAEAEQRMNEAIQIHLDFDESAMLAAAIESIGWSAATAGEDERAAEIFGYVDGIWRIAKLYIARFITDVVGTEVRAGVRRRLGERAWAAATARGASLSSADGLALVRRTVPSAPPAPPARRARSDRASRRRGVTSGASLTRRELQIAQLVADGLSNKEIAARLVVSVRTAEAHVENILTKLSMHSRAQIAVWVRENVANAG